jgi:hypothetical protein
MPVSERDDGTEKLPGFAGGEGDHRIAHKWDADVVSEAAGDFFAVDQTRTGRPRRLRLRRGLPGSLPLVAHASVCGHAHELRLFVGV